MIAQGIERVKIAIERDMPDAEAVEIAKLLMTIRASVKRRTKYGRDYLMFVREFVGMRIDSGVRAIRKPGIF